jgi:hypothetical protein
MAKFLGTSGDDYLFGGPNADTLDGKAGNDLLSGGRGNDRLIGGSGDDCFEIYSDSGRDTFVELANGGFDTVLSMITFSLAASPDRANLEAVELQFGSGNINAIGNTRGNFLLGNEGRNVLSGLDGNDSMRGGLGNDTTNGGKGNDHHVIEQAGDKVKEAVGEGTDTVYSAFAELRLPLLPNVENATLLGSSNLNLFGNDGKNRLTGNSGANRLDGGGGADSLFGEGGNDTMVWNKNGLKFNGGDGNDTLEVTKGNLNLTGKGGGILISTEGVHLVSNSTLTITANDVGAMTADGKLTVTSAGGGILLSSDPLTFLQNTTVGDNTFRVYGGEGGIEVHVQSGIDASSLATNKTPFNGSNGFFVYGAANGDGAGPVTLGDFNGDGLLDIAMGAPGHDGGPSSFGNGAVHIIEGRTDFSAIHGKHVVTELSDAQGVFNFLGPNAGNQAGKTLISGDFNDDGFDDLFTAGPGTNPSGSMVFGSGSPAGFGLSGIDGSNGIVVLPDASGIQFGAAVGAGDVNGDGADDLLITAPGSKVAEEVQGKFYGLFGGVDTKLPDAHGEDGFNTGDIVPGVNGVVFSGGIPGASLGLTVTTGDLNNDGRDDVITTFVQDGKVNIVLAFGGTSGPTITSPADADGLKAVTFFTDIPMSFTGGVFVAAGDVNGDGTADMVVATSNPDSNAPATDNGVVVVNGRNNAGWQTAQGESGAKLADVADFFAYEPTFAGGVSVALGDVDGDGNNDMVFGTPQVNSTSSAGPSGAIKFVRGGAQNLEALDGASNLSALLDGFSGQQFFGQPGDRLGMFVTVGDVNGDGFGDVIAGAPGNSSMPGGFVGIFGTPFANATSFVGTGGADSQTGGADGQSFVAGLGNDTANSGSFDGASFHMGAGDDVVIGNNTARLIDGGAGLDTWIPTSAVLDFTGTLGNRLVDFELINLSETDATVTVDSSGWRGLGGVVGKFKIDGDEGDTVVMPANRILLSFDPFYDYYRLPGMADSRTIGVHNGIIVNDLPE